MFLPHIRPTKHAEHDEIDAKWLGKKLAFWRESWRVGKNIIIANKIVKETEIWVYQCQIEFYFTEWTQQGVFFSSGSSIYDMISFSLFHPYLPESDTTKSQNQLWRDKGA